MASNRLRTVNASQEKDVEMDMSPMIDMVFLLLLFFLVVSNPRTIKIDPEVEPPIAENAKPVEIKHGKIVINIHEDGSFRGESFNTLEFNTEEQLEDYIKKEKDQIDAQGYTPRLHIRGDQDAVFRHCRRVIRSGARAGVDQVVFGAYTNEK